MLSCGLTPSIDIYPQMGVFLGVYFLGNLKIPPHASNHCETKIYQAAEESL